MDVAIEKQLENCVFFDVEVNSLEHREVIEFAFSEGLQAVQCEQYKPHNPIDFEAMSAHHITPGMVADKPYFAGSPQLKRVAELNEAGKIFIAHKADFDVPILNQYLEEANLPPIKNYVCTLNSAKYLHTNKTPDHIPKNYKLQYLRYYYDIATVYPQFTHIQPHRADSDVDVLKAVAMELINRFQIPVDRLQAVTEYCDRPENFEFFFGKHKGMKIKDIDRLDPKYLDWCMNSLEDADVLKKIVDYNKSKKA